MVVRTGENGLLHPLFGDGSVGLSAAREGRVEDESLHVTVPLKVCLPLQQLGLAEERRHVRHLYVSDTRV